MIIGEPVTNMIGRPERRVGIDDLVGDKRSNGLPVLSGVGGAQCVLIEIETSALDVLSMMRTPQNEPKSSA